MRDGIEGKTMSVELPEAQILAAQMRKELPGKTIKSCQLADCEKLQRSGMVNKDIRDFDGLIGGSVESVSSRGSTILVKLDNGMNLVLTPEYGGIILYHTSADTLPEKFHLKLSFDEGTFLTVRQTSMGCINAVPDEGLEQNYVYKRDFLGGPSPTDEDLTFDRFSELLGGNNRMLKSVMIGKDAMVVGVSNSTFQEIAYKARIHPKRKAANLDDERRALYEAMKEIVGNRIRQGGKDDFVDLYGKSGDYKPVMGPHMMNKLCPVCGTAIDKLSIGGGPTYFCPSCQK